MREFWEMTPAETFVAMEATAERMAFEQQRLAWAVWHIAALQRSKRLPGLDRLLHGHKTVELTGAELERRQQEHAELAERMGRGRQNRNRAG